MAKFVPESTKRTAEFYAQHEAEIADKLMVLLESDYNYERMRTVLYADKCKSEDARVFKDLYFLIDGNGTQDPQKWIDVALFDFDHVVAPLTGLSLDTPVPYKCLILKKYRKGLQKYRKEHKALAPADWIGEYLVEELSKLPKSV